MRIEKAVGTIGIKNDGRVYGALPLGACKKAGIDPEGRADIVFIEGKKGQQSRLVFTAVAKHAKLKGQVVVRLKHAPRSRFTHFEQQGTLFKGPVESQDCDVEVHDDKLHLLFPIGITRRSALVKPDPSEGLQETMRKEGIIFDAASTGLTEEGNTACQMIVEAIQQLPGIQMRIFDCMRGRDHDCDPQALWDQLLSEIY
jgi:hypothetical protein